MIAESFQIYLLSFLYLPPYTTSATNEARFVGLESELVSDECIGRPSGGSRLNTLAAVLSPFTIMRRMSAQPPSPDGDEMTERSSSDTRRFCVERALWLLDVAREAYKDPPNDLSLSGAINRRGRNYLMSAELTTVSYFVWYRGWPNGSIGIWIRTGRWHDSRHGKAGHAWLGSA